MVIRALDFSISRLLGSLIVSVRHLPPPELIMHMPEPWLFFTFCTSELDTCIAKVFPLVGRRVVYVRLVGVVDLVPITGTRSLQLIPHEHDPMVRLGVDQTDASVSTVLGHA